MKVGEMEKLDRITVNPDVCLGQPTIRGKQVVKNAMLDCHLSSVDR